MVNRNPGIGDSILRLEDYPFVTGAASYVSDLVDGDTLHCAFVRSPVAHGTFEPPDLEDALEMPGVVAIFDARNLDIPDLPSTPGRGAPEATGMNQPALARDRVRHVGDPIAVVIAQTPSQAVDAAEMVWVDIDPLPAVIDARQSLGGEVLLFPEVGTNLVHENRFATPGPRPEAEVEASVEIDIPRLSPVTLEPLAMLVRPQNGTLEVWCGHQAPSRLPRQLSPFVGIPPEDFRARVPSVGGAFGTKGQFYAEYVVVAVAAHRLNRPLAWIERRGEQFRSGTHGRGQQVNVTVGGDRSGRIRYVKAVLLGEVGAYPSTGSRIPFFSQFMVQGVYDIEHLEVHAIAALTNKAPTGPYRGAGRPEAAISIECAVDAFAAEIDMQPEEVRRRNFISSSQLPFTTHTGAIYDSGNYREALDLALETLGIESWRERQEERRRLGGNPIGIGISSFIERAGGAVGSWEWGRVELMVDGSVEVRTGSTSAGQAHRTVWAQIAASVFDLPVDRTVFHAGDTAAIPKSIGSFSSRSLQLGGSAVLQTARRVRDAVLDLAAEMLEAAPEDLELTNGRVRVVGSPDPELSLMEIAMEAQSRGVELAADEMFNPYALTYPYGAYVAVVEVEIETGFVHLVKLAAVDDCGNVINPMVVEGQVHGSVMQGIGSALLEEVVYDPDGQPLTTSLMDYLIPGATQPMPLQTGRLTYPAPSNPLGAKGTGEAGCIGVPPAIFNAVCDALRPLGVRLTSFPLTPVRVWEAIQAASQERVST